MKRDLVAFLQARYNEEELIATAANPGPWFYNSYSAVFSGPMVQAYDPWVDPLVIEASHTLERQGRCDSCDTDDGCRFFEEEYARDAMIAHVPSHHGDTAIGRRVHDALHIEKQNPVKVLADISSKRFIITAYVKAWEDYARYKDRLDAGPNMEEINFVRITVQTASTMTLTLQDVLFNLALVYADHPDYQDDWRPFKGD